MSSKSIKDVIDVGQGIHHDRHNNHNHHVGPVLDDHVAPVLDDGQGDHHDTSAHDATKELCFCLAFLKHLHLVEDDDNDDDDEDDDNDDDDDYDDNAEDGERLWLHRHFCQ